MYFLIVLFPHLLGWNIIFFRASITRNITGDKHQWTNKYQQTGRRRKIWRLCSGSSTKTSESITILQYWKYYNYYRKPVGYILCNDRVTEWDVMFLSNQFYSLTHNFDLTCQLIWYLLNWLIVSILGNNVDQEEYQSYKDSFDAFDWNNSGREGCYSVFSYSIVCIS